MNTGNPNTAMIDMIATRIPPLIPNPWNGKSSSSDSNVKLALPWPVLILLEFASTSVESVSAVSTPVSYTHLSNKSINFSRPLFSSLTLLLSDIGIPDSSKKCSTRESLVSPIESLGCVIRLSMTSAWTCNKDRNRNKINIRSFKTLLSILVYRATNIQHLCLGLLGVCLLYTSGAGIW